MHKTIKKVSDDFEALKYNTAIAALMTLINDFYKKGEVNKAEYKTFLLLLNPVAPHITEELWNLAGYEGRVYQSKWPDYDDAKTVENEIEIAVQISGKVRGKIMIALDEDKDTVIARAKANEVIAPLIEGKTVIKEIYVPNKIVNIVVK